jgi:hypothetical protein
MQSTLPSCSFFGFMPPHPKMGSNHDPPTLTVLPPLNAATAPEKYAFSAPSTTQRNITENVHPFTDMDQPNCI